MFNLNKNAMNAKKNIATALVAIADVETIRKATLSILSISSEQFQKLFTELTLGIIEWPDEFPQTGVSQDGKNCTLQSINLDEAKVTFSFKTSVKRFFESIEKAEYAIENHRRYDGFRESNEEHNIEGVIEYIDTDYMSITSWLQLKQEGE